MEMDYWTKRCRFAKLDRLKMVKKKLELLHTREPRTDQVKDVLGEKMSKIQLRAKAKQMKTASTDEIENWLIRSDYHCL